MLLTSRQWHTRHRGGRWLSEVFRCRAWPRQPRVRTVLVVEKTGRHLVHWIIPQYIGWSIPVNSPKIRSKFVKPQRMWNVSKVGYYCMCTINYVKERHWGDPEVIAVSSAGPGGLAGLLPAVTSQVLQTSVEESQSQIFILILIYIYIHTYT